MAIFLLSYSYAGHDVEYYKEELRKTLPNAQIEGDVSLFSFQFTPIINPYIYYIFQDNLVVDGKKPYSMDSFFEDNSRVIEMKKINAALMSLEKEVSENGAIIEKDDSAYIKNLKQACIFMNSIQLQIDSYALSALKNGDLKKYKVAKDYIETNCFTRFKGDVKAQIVLIKDMIKSIASYDRHGFFGIESNITDSHGQIKELQLIMSLK